MGIEQAGIAFCAISCAFLTAAPERPAASTGWPDGDPGTGDALVQLADAKDIVERAARGAFDARGDIGCAQERGQALFTCVAGVVRSGSGDAAVAVTFPNGFVRTLYFESRMFVRGSATMSGTGRDTDWELSDGLHRVRVDDQRYELPDAFVFGD